MYRKTTSLITINKLRTLAKVCRPPISYLYSVETPPLVRCFSTATERSDFFARSSEFNGENYQNNDNFPLQQNPNSVYGKSSRNDFQHNPDAENNKFSPEYAENGLANECFEGPVGQDGKFPSIYMKNGQKDGVLENPGTEFANFDSCTSSSYVENGVKNRIFENPIGKNVNFERYNAVSSKDMWQQNTYGYERGGSVEFRHNCHSEYGQNGVEPSGGGSKHHGDVSGGGGFQQSMSNYSSGNYGNYQQSTYGSYAQNAAMLQQSSSSYLTGNAQTAQNTYNNSYAENSGHNGHGEYGLNGVEPSGGGSKHHGDVSGGFQQSMSNYSGGNYGNYPQISYGSYAKNAGMPQNISSCYHTGNAQTSQNTYGNNYAENSGMYHGSSRNPNGYNNAGGCQQSLSSGYGSNVTFYQQISNEPQNANIGTQGETNVKSNEELDEAAGRSELRGTVDDLDKFSEEGKLKEAVKVLGLLEEQHISVDLPRYLILMKACGEDKALEEAKVVHEHLVRSGIRLELKTYNKILEMYCRCGSMDDAFMVFDKMQRRNLTSWDIMISWLGKSGRGEDAIDLFTQFKEMGLKPDGTMFFGVFSACSALGDTVEGLLHFESMSKAFGIVPSMEHYVSVVDMLGSSGHLDEALEFVKNMPTDPSVEVWEALMNLSRMQGNLELGDYCAELVELLDPSRLNEQSRAGLIPVKPSDLAGGEETKNLSGQSLLESRNKVHEYRAGDRSSPEHEKLYVLLWGMKQQMKEAGYIPQTKFVLHDIDLEGKEEALMAHSERLAVAQGLMTTPARNPLRIIKNLRICVDCHNAMKIISKLVGRKLIIRDAKRFHHFDDGLCSCHEFW